MTTENKIHLKNIKVHSIEISLFILYQYQSWLRIIFIKNAKCVLHKRFGTPLSGKITMTTFITFLMYKPRYGEYAERKRIGIEKNVF